jgi:hypothetical protein
MESPLNRHAKQERLRVELMEAAGAKNVYFRPRGNEVVVETEFEPSLEVRDNIARVMQESNTLYSVSYRPQMQPRGMDDF